MNPARLRELLERVAAGEATVESALDSLKTLPYEDLGFAHLDMHRALRRGLAEVIYCKGKTVDEVRILFSRLAETGNNILATRADSAMADAVRAQLPETVYHERSGALVLRQNENRMDCLGPILVVSAGTSDIPVAEEAALTAAIMGNPVKTVYDVGVAGIHRLLGRLREIREASVLVVVAGMEGALASVVAGMVSVPVVAVPTSTGYGASFGGLAALLAMLNSCADGVTVVNIDNGFGAGYAASVINQLPARLASGAASPQPASPDSASR